MELLEQASHKLERDNPRQAGEKIWSACALAIKAHALVKKGKRIESHAELWVYKNEVARELDDWVESAFMQADSMHKSFYEGLATKENVEAALRGVEKLVKPVLEVLRK